MNVIDFEFSLFKINIEIGDVEINLLATIYKMMNSLEEIPLLETTNKVLHMNTYGVHRQFFSVILILPWSSKHAISL